MHRFSTYERWQDGGTWYYLVQHKKILLEHGLELVLAFEVRPRTTGTRKATRIKTAAALTPKVRRSWQPSPIQSGYSGVTWHAPTSRWQVQLYILGQVRHWGSFPDMEEALVRHDAVVLAYRGDQAVTHLVPEAG
jgi:hypothetical protein